MATTLLKFTAGNLRSGVVQAKLTRRPTCPSFSTKTPKSSPADSKDIPKDVCFKAGLVKEICEIHELKKSHAEKILTTVFDTISENLQNGRDVRIRGFGTFSRVEQQQKTMRNLFTKEIYEVPSKNRIRFKTSKSLKAAINSTAPTP